MAMGKLVVASDVGGLKELVRDGETGLLFPAGDAEALTRVLHGTIAGRESWKAMGDRAREHVRAERRWEEIAARYRPAYAYAQTASPGGRGA
jgi:glycosyltransferase involved in cell wall biosynthesis